MWVNLWVCCGEVLTSWLPSAVEFSSSRMKMIVTPWKCNSSSYLSCLPVIITVIIESWWRKERNWVFLIALGNWLIRASPQRASCCRRVVCCLFIRNLAKLADFRCLELCAGTLFVLLLKFGAVLSIISGYEWLFFFLFFWGGDFLGLLWLYW